MTFLPMRCQNPVLTPNPPQGAVVRIVSLTPKTKITIALNHFIRSVRLIGSPAKGGIRMNPLTRILPQFVMEILEDGGLIQHVKKSLRLKQ